MIKTGERLDRVLRMTLQGHSQADIAHAMRISENTVKGYRRRLRAYYGAANKAALIEKLLARR
jgi:DNA-binding CsgD family transcriptional regulator